MNQLTWLGIAFILVGVSLIVLPLLGKYLPSEIPWWLVYVYRSDGFFFATSPLLLAISAVSALVYFLNR